MTDTVTGVNPVKQLFLAADIGGTHARVGLVSSSSQRAPEVRQYRSYRCRDFSSLEQIIGSFCTELDTHPRELVLACAGYAHEGAVVNDNLVWPVVPLSMERSLALDRVSLLNDFEALAHATPHIDARNTVVLRAPSVPIDTSGPVVVIGPGTGLGAAVWFPGEPPRVLATEAGQIQLTARQGLEQQVFAQLSAAGSHTPYEAVLSGPGLRRLYNALCAIHGRDVALDDPVAITAAALDGSDAVAYEALNMFCSWLGSLIGDLAMLYGATGGICLAGGFLSQIAGFMQRSSLVERFLDKGVMRPFLNKVPVHVIGHGQLGVIGAASWYLDVRNRRS
ncbi:MAG: glucokinase [Rhodanobacter sp.]